MKTAEQQWREERAAKYAAEKARKRPNPRPVVCTLCRSAEGTLRKVGDVYAHTPTCAEATGRYEANQTLNRLRTVSRELTGIKPGLRALARLFTSRKG